MTYRMLVSKPRIEPMPPELEAQNLFFFGGGAAGSTESQPLDY